MAGRREDPEVDDDPKDEYRGAEVHQVGQVLAVEGLTQGTDLVLAGGEQAEQGDDGALELGAAASVDGGRGEALPDNRLADCLNEEGDAGALLEQLVLEEDDEAVHKQLDDGHEAHAGPDVARLSVHASHHIDSICAPLIKALCLLLRNVAHLDQTCVWKRRINRD